MNIARRAKDIKSPNGDLPRTPSVFPAFDRLWTKREFLEARLIERRAVVRNRKASSIIAPPWQCHERITIEARW